MLPNAVSTLEYFSQPFGARSLLPCIDEPAYKATFDVIVSVRQPGIEHSLIALLEGSALYLLTRVVAAAHSMIPR